MGAACRMRGFPGAPGHSFLKGMRGRGRVCRRRGVPARQGRHLLPGGVYTTILCVLFKSGPAGYHRGARTGDAPQKDLNRRILNDEKVCKEDRRAVRRSRPAAVHGGARVGRRLYRAAGGFPNGKF